MLSRILTLLWIVIGSQAFGQYDPAAWPMYQHDAQRTSRNDFVAVVSPPAFNWVTDCAAFSSTSIATDNVGNVFLGTGWFGFTSLDPVGALRWAYPPISGEPIVLPTGHVVCASGSGDLFDPDGHRLMRFYIPGGSPRIVVTDQGFIVGSNGISKPFEGSYVSLSTGYEAVIGRDGNGYSVKGSGLWAISLDQFDMKGSVKTSPIAIHAANPARIAFFGKNQLVFTAYFGESPSFAGGLVCIDTKGNVLWSVAWPGGTASSPVVGRDGTVYAYLYLGAVPLSLVAVKGGQVLWTTPLFNELDSARPPVIDADGSILVVNREGRIVCLAHDGTFKWSKDVPPVWHYSIPMDPCLSPSGLIVGANDGFLYSLKTETKRRIVKATVEFDGIAASASPPTIEYDVRLPGSNLPFLWRRVNPNADGTYSLDLPVGSFDIGLKADKWLSALVPSVDYQTSEISVFCLGGDVNNDDAVDLSDVNAVLIDFMGSEADVDLDGETNLLDFNEILINFGLVGEW